MNEQSLSSVWRSVNKTREELAGVKTHLEDHVCNCTQINQSINKKVNYLFILAFTILFTVIGGMGQILIKMTTPYVELL